MTARDVMRFLFMLYCLEVGAMLLMLPWSPLWDRQVIALPFAELQAVALRPLARGAVSGFGLVHLLWGVHDLEAWIRSRHRRRDS